MKTAISINDELFQDGEKFAQKNQYSRSQLYAMALRDFLDAQKKMAVTNSLNAVYSKIDAATSNEDIKLQLQSIPKEEW